MLYFETDDHRACLIYRLAEDRVLLGTTDPVAARVLHEVEVFGPVATLMPYRDEAHALALVRRGQGSLVASVYGTQADDLAIFQYTSGTTRELPEFLRLRRALFDVIKEVEH